MLSYNIKQSMENGIGPVYGLSSSASYGSGKTVRLSTPMTISLSYLLSEPLVSVVFFQDSLKCKISMLYHYTQNATCERERETERDRERDSSR